MKRYKDSNKTLINILVQYDEEIVKAKQSKYKIDIYNLAYRIINDHKGKITNQELFKVLGITRQAYHEWAKHKSNKASVDEEAEVMILEVFDRHNHKIGQKTIQAIIERETGWTINHKKIQRIMQLNNIHGEYRSKKLYSREKKAEEFHPDDLIKQNFKSSRPNEKWSTDYCQIKTNRGTIYVMAIIDVFDNRVVHWGYRLLKDSYYENQKLSDHSSRVLEQAFIKFKCKNVIVQTDHGVEFFNERFKGVIEKYGSYHSAGRPGKHLDNRPVEYFWSILRGKALMAKRRQKEAFKFEDAISKIEKFLNKTYNTSIQGDLNWKSPYERYNDYCFTLEELARSTNPTLLVKKAVFEYHNKTFGFDISWEDESDQDPSDEDDQ